MRDSDNQLALRLKIKFGLAPQEPEGDQLRAIKRDIQAIADRGQFPLEQDWLRIVHRHCPGAGKYAYAGQDNSDLTLLLQLATSNNG